MTGLEILQAAKIAADKIRAFVESAIAANPDLAPAGQQLLDELNAAIGADALVALAEKLPAQIANIAHGNLDPRDSPSNAA